MTIQFRPGFLRLLKTIAMAVAICLVGAAVYNYFRQIVEFLLFAFASELYTLMNAVVLLGVATAIGWFIPWLIATRVLEGVQAPKLPWRVWKCGLIAASVVGLLLTPIHIQTHRAIARALEPIAREFYQKAGCDGYGCYVDESVLKKRDHLVAKMDGHRIGGWWVENRLGYGAHHYTESIYLWRPPGFLF